MPSVVSVKSFSAQVTNSPEPPGRLVFSVKRAILDAVADLVSEPGSLNPEMVRKTAGSGRAGLLATAVSLGPCASHLPSPTSKLNEPDCSRVTVSLAPTSGSLTSSPSQSCR
ncbi:hypothetical protein IscW_ISCW017138 [Ixodes scapularis]|uniref:Uncharacterized protein n=1 Tax=Ixodes scapularis TaxID=6945 RepID=B7PA97_IXOSC|nr:hypothetical protein IscW_ISCW017138 [Ixodes scapularis]|eukprot:XP_002406666.1 hypothetical protein IscW_ISCW017138 [Ixodes scapularis]